MVPAIQFDYDQLQHISGNDPEFETELLELFLSDLKSQLDILASAIAQTNIRQVEEVAHYVKGSSANVGVVSISNLASELEVHARGQAVDQASHYLAQLVTHTEQFETLLHTGQLTAQRPD